MLELTDDRWIDLSVLNLTEDEIDELKRLRILKKAARRLLFSIFV